MVMPGSLFSVTPTPPTLLKLAPGEEGRFSFTITVLAAPDKMLDVTLRALVDNNGKREEVGWLSIEPDRTQRMAGGATEVATVIARPTSKSPGGDHRIQLAVYDDERPHDNYTYSAPVVCSIVGTRQEVEPGKPRLPRWLIPAISAAGLLGVVALVVASMNRGAEPGDVGKLAGVDGRIAAVASNLAAVENKLAAAENRVATAQSKLAATEGEVARLRAIVDTLTRRKSQKLCSVVVGGDWRDSIVVDDTWRAPACASWAQSVGAPTWQLGCLHDNAFSWGTANGGQPNPNCNW
jgi:hypothetical protein